MVQNILKSEMGAVPVLTDVLVPGTQWHGEEVPDMTGIDVAKWGMAIKQVGLKKKIGSIHLPEQLQDAQGYTHGLGIVLKLGPSCFRGKKCEDLGITPENSAKVGDIILFQAATVPRRIKVDGIEILFINDDAYYGTVEPSEIHRISFKL